MPKAAVIQDRFRWRERMRKATMGVYVKNEVKGCIWDLRNTALQLRMDAAKLRKQATGHLWAPSTDSWSAGGHYGRAGEDKEFAKLLEDRAQMLEGQIENLIQKLGGQDEV